MNTHFSFFMFLALTALMLFSPSASSADSECEPSKWGASDELGSANLISTASVLAAADLIKQGKTQPLGIVIDQNTPAFGPRSLQLQIIQPLQEWGKSPFPNGVSYNDDVFQGWFGIGSQLDGLSHLGQHGVFYNCNRGADFVQTGGVTKLGVENVPPLVARGVVLDMAGHFGKDFLDAGEFFTADQVKAVSKQQGTPIRKGDVVIFYTGWTDHVLENDPQKWGAAEPGIAEDVATYLAAADVLAVGADTWGLDVVPPQFPERIFPGHITLLKENGIYILETMNVGPLVRDGAYEFLFVLGANRIKGTVQSYINPVAIY